MVTRAAIGLLNIAPLGAAFTCVASEMRVAMTAMVVVLHVAVAISLLWLSNGGPTGLYGWAIGLFALQLVAVFASATWATRMVLWQ